MATTFALLHSGISSIPLASPMLHYIEESKLSDPCGLYQLASSIMADLCQQGRRRQDWTKQGVWLFQGFAHVHLLAMLLHAPLTHQMLQATAVEKHSLKQDFLLSVFPCIILFSYTSAVGKHAVIFLICVTCG
jgi:hypothetical protein